MTVVALNRGLPPPRFPPFAAHHSGLAEARRSTSPGTHTTRLTCLSTPPPPHSAAPTLVHHCPADTAMANYWPRVCYVGRAKLRPTWPGSIGCSTLLSAA